MSDTSTSRERDGPRPSQRSPEQMPQSETQLMFLPTGNEKATWCAQRHFGEKSAATSRPLQSSGLFIGKLSTLRSRLEGFLPGKLNALNVRE